MELKERAIMAHALSERMRPFSQIIAKFRNGDIAIGEVREDLELQMEYLQDELNRFVEEVKKKNEPAPA